MPEMGSHPSRTPRRSMQMSASQKLGTEKPMNTNTVMARSRMLPRLTAEITPSGMATRKMRIMEEMLMEMVMGSRSLILSHTGRASDEMELPKSSLARLFIQRKYWTVSGLSRP